jgi:hypothetical protein
MVKRKSTRKNLRKGARKSTKRSALSRTKRGGVVGCGHGDDCPKGGKHKWGLVGAGNYKCQNGCGCYFDDH